MRKSGKRKGNRREMKEKKTRGWEQPGGRKKKETGRQERKRKERNNNKRKRREKEMEKGIV